MMGLARAGVRRLWRTAPEMHRRKMPSCRPPLGTDEDENLKISEQNEGEVPRGRVEENR